MYKVQFRTGVGVPWMTQFTCDTWEDALSKVGSIAHWVGERRIRERIRGVIYLEYTS